MDALLVEKLGCGKVVLMAEKMVVEMVEYSAEK